MCDRSAENAYPSMAPDLTFAFVGGPCCPTLDLVIAFWIMIYVLHIVNFAILYFNHRTCITAGGQLVPEGTCRSVYILP